MELAREKERLLRAGIRPRRRLGQSFLVRAATASRIARTLETEPDEPILEIGPGSGALTRALLATGSPVWAIEVDPALAAVLRERFSAEITAGRLTLIEGNVLDFDPARLPGVPERALYLAGNLPYAITTPILLWMLEHRDRFRRAGVLVQKEFADRIVAPPGSRTYGSLSVWIAYHASVRRRLTVGPGEFWPAPKVDSSLVDFRFHRTPPVHVRDPRDLERVLSTVFGQRRKMLRSSLGTALGDRAVAIGLLDHAGIAPTRRPETLDLGEFAALANTLGEAL
ncbi:MAG: 16S rRNA (adenine(1518)-N(6)/adenine(1519)-N(6))-dimethyltransferase RsmA [Candidatus Eisenbacteria bacterium]|nr:16S rRNA (adenine(1518)-N(6)/adenine(1519)-N(6))-dimethyltransferase RsmA [Candidatus Latescibacterota bacterium]MBD3301552.1 16S rRNA (adenine(1518)-N(6)/adenine(1519)-N(6))-dimethyltransferase RsmA [Candidatus Eisenbacteria bacterium]